MLTYVLAADGSPLMPTYNIKKVRHMLKDGRAVIAGHKPGFTIQLTYALPDQKIPNLCSHSPKPRPSDAKPRSERSLLTGRPS